MSKLVSPFKETRVSYKDLVDGAPYYLTDVEKESEGRTNFNLGNTPIKDRPEVFLSAFRDFNTTFNSYKYVLKQLRSNAFGVFYVEDNVTETAGTLKINLSC